MLKKYFTIFLFIVLTCFSQTTLIVSGPSSGWNGIQVSPDQVTTTFLADPLADQQTGQGADDLLGLTTHAGLYMDLGTIGGVDSIGFRFYMAKYEPAGFSGNLRVGIDADGDGAVDLFFGPKLGGNIKSQGIYFQTATGAGNYSPSTTALSKNYNQIAFTPDNYDYRAIDSIIDPLWANMGADTNSVISFGLSTQVLKDAFAGIGITLTDQTYMTFLAFTSTQGNAINQDLFGSVGITNTARFDGVGGGFSDYYALDGSYLKRPIVPEPSTYGMVFMTLIGLLYLRRKK